MYMRKFECQICYEQKRSIIKCFHKCSAIICNCCFKKLIELDEANKISYKCPMCREVAVRHMNRKFTMYCNKNIDILKRVVSILEKQNELDIIRETGENWAYYLAIQEQHNHWDYIDFDNDLPDAIPHRIFRRVSI